MPKTTSIKKRIYTLSTSLEILFSHLLCLSLSKLSRNCIWDTAINLKLNFEKLSVVVHVLQSTQNWSFHVVVLQRTAKKCKKNYNACAEPLFCSLNLLFSDVPVAVAVVVICLWLRRLWSSENFIVGVTSRSGRINQWQCSILGLAIGWLSSSASDSNNLVFTGS